MIDQITKLLFMLMSIREYWESFIRLTIDDEASKNVSICKVECDSYLILEAIELKLELAVQFLLEVIHDIEKIICLVVL